MIPLRDHNPTSSPAIVVPIFIAINVVVFLFVQPTFAGGSQRQQIIDQTKFFACRAAIPYEVTHGETVLEGFESEELRGSSGTLIAVLQNGSDETGRGCPRKNIWISILTSMFLHGGWLHIGGNMLFLWVFGNNVEDRLGRARFVLFYVLAGIAATYAQSFINTDSTVPMVGASGAIAGILGAYLIMFPHARVTTLVPLGFFLTTFELPAIVVLGLWFVLQFFQSVAGVTGETGGVAYMAHVGGFVAGVILLLVFRPRRGRPPAYEP